MGIERTPYFKKYNRNQPRCKLCGKWFGIKGKRRALTSGLNVCRDCKENKVLCYVGSKCKICGFKHRQGRTIEIRHNKLILNSLKELNR